MTKFRGLCYVKHGRVGSRSEGPDYHLQTYNADYLLRYHDRRPWEPDYHLEFFGRRMVEVEGKLIDRQTIQVVAIQQIVSPLIPRPGQVGPSFGEPFELKFGQRVRFDDAAIELAFLGVNEDSRCPVGVTCVWAGRCVVVLSLTPDGEVGQKFDLTAQAGQGDLAAADVLGYHVQLHDVKPYPRAGEPQAPHEQYVVTIEVSRIE